MSCSSGREEIGSGAHARPGCGTTHHQFKYEGQNRGKMTGGAAHLIGTGRGRVAQETQNTRPVWRWVREGREGA
jgi:hypothetical protein